MSTMSGPDVLVASTTKETHSNIRTNNPLQHKKYAPQLDNRIQLKHNNRKEATHKNNAQIPVQISVRSSTPFLQSKKYNTAIRWRSTCIHTYKDRQTNTDDKHSY